LKQHASGTDCHERALALLAEATVLALEGRPRSEAAAAKPIHAPLPLHASTLVNQLVAGSSDSRAARERLECFYADLQATQLEPPEITRRMRAEHLIWHTLAVSLAVSCWLMIVGIMTYLPGNAPGQEGSVPLALIGLTSVLFVFLFFLPAYATRGGVSFARVGFAVVRKDGRPASRFRCLWRALLCWSFMAVLAGLVICGLAMNAEVPRPGHSMVVLAAFLFVYYVSLTLQNPARAPHDFVAGTYLVPK
jgi:uncharacterized RDD family membrane protein YckC